MVLLLLPACSRAAAPRCSCSLLLEGWKALLLLLLLLLDAAAAAPCSRLLLLLVLLLLQQQLLLLLQLCSAVAVRAAVGDRLLLALRRTSVV